MKTRKGTEISQNRRPLADLTEFTVTGGGEICRSESGAVGSGKRSHDRFEKAWRRENGRSQRILSEEEVVWVFKSEFRCVC